MRDASYHFELHCHSHYSADAVSHPEEMIVEAKKRGLSGFAITDHNTSAAVDYFLKRGYMREDGMAVNGFLIIPGVEISTAEGHLLSLGATFPPNSLKDKPAAEVCKLIHKAGGIAIPPHPFDRFRSGIRSEMLDTIEFDAIEIFNSASSLRTFNNQAQAYAENKKVPMIVGSDSHDVWSLGTSQTVIEGIELSVRGVLQAIREGRTTLQPAYLSRRAKWRKNWNSWTRIAYRRPAEACSA